MSNLGQKIIFWKKNFFEKFLIFVPHYFFYFDEDYFNKWAVGPKNHFFSKKMSNFGPKNFFFEKIFFSKNF